MPRKNLRPVGGSSLVARAVAAAAAATRIDRVVVSTDDPEIAAEAERWGAQIVWRPAELSGDTAGSESALLHALDALDADGVDVGILAFLQATSPFIDPAALDRAVEQVDDGRYDSVFSAFETYGFLWQKRADDTDVDVADGVNHDPAHRPRRQDREPHFLETGAFYVMSAPGFRAARHRFFGRVGIVEVAESSAIEIDSEEQLRFAEAIEPIVRASSVADDAIDVDAVVTDFDGVHTDDSVYVDETGRESVRVSRSDGMGVGLLRAAGVPVLILSKERNPVVAARARKLRVEVRQGVDDKATALREWAGERGIPLSRVAYLGNDVNDLPCLEIVGWPVAVPDAHPVVLQAARTMLDRRGGSGAVRALAERVLRARQGSAAVARGPASDSEPEPEPQSKGHA